MIFKLLGGGERGSVLPWLAGRFCGAAEEIPSLFAALFLFFFLLRFGKGEYEQEEGGGRA